MTQAALEEVDAQEKPINRFDVDRIREDFPILNRRIHGRPLVYLDSAATSQKPQVVIDAITNHYATQNANVHHGAH
jgi:cysteine desulfurase / selenocysteine lyase